MSIKKITVEQAHQMQKEKSTFLIDVRELFEFEEARAEHAINIPLDEINKEKLEQIKVQMQDQVLLICRSGRRSMTAAQLLESQGFEKLFNVEGGTLAWIDAGLPIEED